MEEKMEENKSDRTVAQVQEDYFRTAAQAGEAQFKMSRIAKDLELLNKRLLDLNWEAVSIQAAAVAAEGEQKNV